MVHHGSSDSARRSFLKMIVSVYGDYKVSYGIMKQHVTGPVSVLTHPLEGVDIMIEFLVFLLERA